MKHANLKISKGIGILTTLRRYLSKGVPRTQFYDLVQPHIDYGLLVSCGNQHMTIFQIQLNLPSALKTEITEKANSNTIFLIPT